MAELQLDGWAEIKQRFADLPDKMMKRVLTQAMREAANLIKDEAKMHCPVDTGALRDSIRTVARRGTPTRVVFNVVAGGEFTASKQEKYGIKSPYYALFVERGTIKAPPHPFMRPAIEQGAQAAIDRVVMGVSDRLPEVVT